MFIRLYVVYFSNATAVVFHQVNIIVFILSESYEFGANSFYAFRTAVVAVNAIQSHDTPLYFEMMSPSAVSSATT